MTPDTSPDLSSAQTLPATIQALPRDASRPPQTQFSRSLQAKFLRRLADSGEVRVAVSALPVSHQTVYRMRRACRAFAQGWDAALIVARQKAEDILASRAMHGVEEEVYYHGEVVATRRRYDARLLLAHLARLDRKAENADMAALAQKFDAVVEAFETHAPETHGPETHGAAGQDEDLEALNETVDLTPVTLPETAPETSPGPCNTWSMSQPETHEPDALEAEALDPEDLDPEDLDPEDLDPEDLDPEGPPELERRLQAMEAARPEDAPSVRELAEACSWQADPMALGGAALDGGARAAPDPGAVEAAQLLAFEAGEENWWLETGISGASEEGPDEALGPDDVELHAGVAPADHADLAGGAA